MSDIAESDLEQVVPVEVSGRTEHDLTNGSCFFFILLTFLFARLVGLFVFCLFVTTACAFVDFTLLFVLMLLFKQL